MLLVFVGIASVIIGYKITKATLRNAIYTPGAFWRRFMYITFPTFGFLCMIFGLY